MEKVQNFFQKLDEDTIVKSVLGAVGVGASLWILEDLYQEYKQNSPLRENISFLWSSEEEKVAQGIEYIQKNATKTSEEKEKFVEFGVLQGLINILKAEDGDIQQNVKVLDLIQALVSSNANARSVFAKNGGISILLDLLFKNEKTYERKTAVTLLKATEFDTTLQVLPSDVPLGAEASYYFTNESDERLVNFLNFLKSKDSDTSSAVIGILCNCSHYSYFAMRLNKLSEEDEIVSTLIGRLTGSSQKTKIDALKTLTNICNQNFTPYAELVCSFANGTPKNILDLYFTDKNAPKYILDLYCLIFDYLYKESRDTEEDEESDQNAEKIAAMMLDKNSGLKKLQELFPLILNDEYQSNIQRLIGLLTAEEFLREDLRKQFQKVAKESEEKALEAIKKKQQDEAKKEKEREMMMMQMMGGFGGM